MASFHQQWLEKTHEVLNQPPPLEHYDLFSSDRPLQAALEREGGSWAKDRVASYGKIIGSLWESGFLANESKPILRTHDRFGHRIDEIAYHPAYHSLMQTAIEHGLHSLPWREPRPGAMVARAAMSYMHTQVEAGTGCPLTMTFACIPAIRQEPSLASLWEEKILALSYDPRNVPASQKSGVTVGMAMTEKQGGTDVRSNTTQARPLHAKGPGQPYELVGHKWFCSAPMCDLFLTLAQTEDGLSCFLLPRWRPDGSQNAMQIQRLKNKLGNASNASSEIEYRGALAWMVGDEGRGVRTIIEMVSMTRFDCMLGSSALMRQAVAQAIHHCAHRQAFGRELLRQPLMTNVLADLALESEAALVLSMRVARALDAQASDEAEHLFARLATAIGKYWVCKRAPAHINEAQECLGGAGYVEESILPRLYREAPVNSIWEGSGNVQCLDVLRAVSREPETLAAVLSEIKKAQGSDRRLDASIRSLEADLTDTDDLPYRARLLVQKLALCLQASLLFQTEQTDLAEAFCAGRLSGDSCGHTYGILPRHLPIDAILERHRPWL